MTSKFVSRGLTTCQAIARGAAVRIDFVDEGDRPVSIELPFEQAESLSMTLPQLLSSALKLRNRDDQARYAFPLGQWLLETAVDPTYVLATLKTIDGFEVTFTVPLDTCMALGWALQHEADNGSHTKYQ